MEAKGTGFQSNEIFYSWLYWLDVQQCGHIKSLNLYTLNGWIVLCELYLSKTVKKYCMVGIQWTSQWYILYHPPTNAGDSSSIPSSGRSPGVGNGNTLQYSCLGKPMDRGAWWPVVHGVVKELKTIYRLHNRCTILPYYPWISHTTKWIEQNIFLCSGCF